VGGRDATVGMHGSMKPAGRFLAGEGLNNIGSIGPGKVCLPARGIGPNDEAAD
jgi:hypothetical protein